MADPATCYGCGHSEHEADDCSETTGYDHLNGDHECGCPTPPRPVIEHGPRGEMLPPEGWGQLLLGHDGTTTLAGWTSDGVFYAYADTETIVRACMDALTEMMMNR